MVPMARSVKRLDIGEQDLRVVPAVRELLTLANADLESANDERIQALYDSLYAVCDATRAGAGAIVPRPGAGRLSYVPRGPIPKPERISDVLFAGLDVVAARAELRALQTSIQQLLAVSTPPNHKVFALGPPDRPIQSAMSCCPTGPAHAALPSPARSPTSCSYGPSC